MHRPIRTLPWSLLALLILAAATPAVARDGHGRYSTRSSSGYPHATYSHHGSRHGSYHGSYHGHRYGYPSRGYYSPYYYGAHHYGAPYYYHGSSWYRPYGPGYGVAISVLPPFYTTLWYGGSPYYYADNTYYTYRPERREYVVTEPPGGSDEIYVYPKDGQSDERQSIDRDQCHQWAVARTGFDPTQVARTTITTKRADYRRAEAACLEGRGYSVR